MKNNSLFVGNGNFVVLVAFLATIVLFLFCSFLGFVSFAATLFVAYKLRNDTRHIFSNTQNILAPIDGEVMAVVKEKEYKKIYCKSTAFGSSKVLAPIQGDIAISFFQKGLHLNPNSFKGSLLNEQLKINITNDIFTIDLEIFSGKYNCPLENSINKKAIQGEYISALTDGIVVVRVKNDIELGITIGERLVAGQTKLNTVS